MMKIVYKKWVAAMIVTCMLLSSMFGLVGKSSVSQANTGANLLSGLDATKITSARAWIDSTNKITSVSTYSNTAFENTKIKKQSIRILPHMQISLVAGEHPLVATKL